MKEPKKLTCGKCGVESREYRNLSDFSDLIREGWHFVRRLKVLLCKDCKPRRSQCFVLR